MSLYPLARALLFALPPERAHGVSLTALRLAAALAPGRWLLRALFDDPHTHEVEAFGLRFRNPIGLAAGYDKDGLVWRGLACLGFGHVEVGTVTPLPQPGNPRPRVFRLKNRRALINRMGFPSRGAQFVARQLTGPRPTGLVLGVNIGKNRDTPLEQAAEDYTNLVDTFAPLADYLAINVSSPNTVGLRRLQARDALQALLQAVVKRRDACTQQLRRRVPLLVKLAPDLDDDELDDALSAVLDSGLDGVIATNTTISRAGLEARWQDEAGGLSGAPLTTRSTQMVQAIHQRSQGRLPIIGVGGIASIDDARDRLDAGATLVQVYTGLVYQGPGLVRRLLRQLLPRD